MATNNIQRQPDGHITQVYVSNFAGFAEKKILETDPFPSHTKKNPAYSSIFLVGPQASGKRLMLECVSAINILRYKYKVCSTEVGIKLERYGSSQQYSPLECSTDKCGSMREDVCKYSIREAQTLEDLLHAHHGHSICFPKTEPGKPACFIVKTMLGKGKAYYGLYTASEEDSWCWHKQEADGSYKYSVMFVYVEQEQSVYILSPTTKRSISKQVLSIMKCPTGEILGAPALVDVIGKMLNGHGLQMECTETIPDNVKAILPTAVCCSQMKERAKIMINDSVMKLFMNFHTSCFVTCEYFGEKHDRTGLEHLNIINQTRGIQFLMKTNEPKCIRYFANPIVIRTWTLHDGTYRRAAQVNKDIIKRLKKKKHSRSWSVLCANMVLLVEGPSDMNVLEGLFSLWINDKATAESLNSMLKYTLVESVDGKGKLSKMTYLLLHLLHMGLLHCIVCDGDAVIGCSANEMPKIMKPPLDLAVLEEYLKSSQIIGETGVLFRYLYHSKTSKENRCFDQWHRMYKQLVGVLFATTQSLSNLVEMADPVFQESCKSLCSVQSFPVMDGSGVLQEELLWAQCEKCLHVFVWQVGSYDLESAIALNGKTYRKSALANEYSLALSVAKDLRAANNKEIRRLHDYFLHGLCPHYKSVLS